MSKTPVLVTSWLPEGEFEKLAARFEQYEFLDGREPAERDRHLARAVITYGLPPVEHLDQADSLRWIQLVSAGVPQDLCPVSKNRQLMVTNLAGLYGPSIAEHALTMMGILARNLHQALMNQQQERWDRSIAHTMYDLQGRNLAVIGLGNIGRAIARLAHAYGMRVLGCRRRDQPTAFVDRVYPVEDLHAMLAEADVIAVAAPLTRHTDGMLGQDEFNAMKQGVLYISVSRGAIAREEALLEAFHSGKVSAAGLDVFSVEPLPAGHPFWTMPQVLVSPHYCGETINQSARPVQRFARNLEAWAAGQPLEGVVDLEWGY